MSGVGLFLSTGRADEVIVILTKRVELSEVGWGVVLALIPQPLLLSGEGESDQSPSPEERRI